MKLSTKSIGRDAAPIVAEAIRNVAGTLKIADISDIIAGRPEAEVLNALTTVSDALSTCTLDELNVSDNALGEKGIRACAAAFTSQKALKGVYLQNIGCSVNACKAVNELIASTSLETLHLFNNMSDNEGAISIAALLQRNPSIRVRLSMHMQHSPDNRHKTEYKTGCPQLKKRTGYRQYSRTFW